MELFLSFAPSHETRLAFLDAAEQAQGHATGEKHRYETLHSTLTYLGEIDEVRLPEIRDLVGEVAGRHHPLPVKGKGIEVSHDTSVYNAWGLLYIWEKTPEVQALFEDMRDTLTEKGFLKNYEREYLLHSTLFMKYFPNEGEEEWVPSIPAPTDCFDEIILYQVTTIDDHVAYYPLYWARLK